MGTLRKDLTGKPFGQLTVLDLADRKNGKAHWRCKCSCGEEARVQGYNLTSGHTVSCGCKRETNKATLRHGMSKTRVHGIWRGMLKRCGNTGNRLYGGRGIAVCERWRTFEAFYADMGDPSPGSSIERKNNAGPYAPGNCKWATQTEQGRNKRNNRLVTREGVTLPMSAWIERLGLNTTTVYERQRRGWPEDRLLDPARPQILQAAGQTAPPRRAAATKATISGDHAP